MKTERRFATVAVSGPLRKTFAYHLPDQLDSLEPGQRVMVEFGRTRLAGFYLGPPKTQPEVRTKPILKALDPVSHIPRDLFDLCLWISDYYFANPADCLAAALPSVLKTKRAAKMRWADSMPASVPSRVQPFVRAGKPVSSSQLESLRKLGRGLIPELVTQGAIVEEWLEAETDASTIVSGYRVAMDDQWQTFFERRKFKPEKFDGELDREALAELGWTDHYLNTAVKAGLLQPVRTIRTDAILKFVDPKEGVTKLAANEGQQAAIDQMQAKLGNGFSVSLLHGVTGSGKTLVYCHLAQKALDAGQTVLYLTPEIALSGSALAYLRGFFGDIVTVMHSAMTQRERVESWRGIRQGRYRIVVGPRSALFAPLEGLGLIIVDEEHDSSYKQMDPAPRFHGRDAAIVRAKLNKIPILLGSASPSLESYHHAKTGRYDLLTLSDRPAGAELPVVTIIDMSTQRLKGDTPYMSFLLKQKIDQRLEADQQAILFLNRRGYSPQLKCADCGHVPVCPHCEIKLTFHKTGRKLACHYCGYLSLALDTCDFCSGNDLIYPGTGTQKVEEHVSRLFERGKVLRFDSDTASGRKNAHQLLRAFADRKYNLLLGTQMVTKGLDLPGVTLVGVLSADMGLDLPDFRANEKTFARLLQVAGRSGRGVDRGEVFIQTYYPESDVIRDAARQDFETFFAREIESRRTHNFPPFARLIRFVLASKDKTKVEESTTRFTRELKERATACRLVIKVMGPAACPIALLRGATRKHLIVKTTKSVGFVRMLTEWENEKPRFGLPATVKISIDVDPDDMM